MAAALSWEGGRAGCMAKFIDFLQSKLREDVLMDGGMRVRVRSDG